MVAMRARADVRGEPVARARVGATQVSVRAHHLVIAHEPADMCEQRDV